MVASEYDCSQSTGLALPALRESMLAVLRGLTLAALRGLTLAALRGDWKFIAHLVTLWSPLTDKLNVLHCM